MSQHSYQEEEPDEEYVRYMRAKGDYFIGVLKLMVGRPDSLLVLVASAALTVFGPYSALFLRG